MTKISDKNVRKLIYSKYNCNCAYCGRGLTSKNFTIDHIYPKRRHLRDKNKKGLDILENYNPCCKSCNSSKASYELEVWREQIKLKHIRLLRDSSSYRLLNRFELITIKEDVEFYFEKLNKWNLE